ncbi:MAG: nucleotidyltransferase domain-containing protein [Bdellovibrio sp.]|nr:nucleotidyltransferase domain-containing protein [Bdellovibrio sp.]
MKISIAANELKWIRKEINKILPQSKILAFGSRVRGDHKSFSDLDLSLDCGSPIPLEKLSLLKEIFSQSTLPYSIDLIDWQRIDTDFRKIILENNLEL